MKKPEEICSKEVLEEIPKQLLKKKIIVKKSEEILKEIPENTVQSTCRSLKGLPKQILTKFSKQFLEDFFKSIQIQKNQIFKNKS